MVEKTAVSRVHGLEINVQLRQIFLIGLVGSSYFVPNSGFDIPFCSSIEPHETLIERRYPVIRIFYVGMKTVLMLYRVNKQLMRSVVFLRDGNDA